MEINNNSDEDFYSDEDIEIEQEQEQEDNKVYNIESKEYKQYKKNILGIPNYSKNTLSSYTLENRLVYSFCKNIKEYGLNLQINEGHYKKIKDELLSDENPIIYNEFVVVEYKNLETEDVKSLCELLDGHHRLRALLDIYNIQHKFNIVIRVIIIQSDLPNSIETKSIFRKFNIIKPFEVDFDIMKISELLIIKLNTHFRNKYNNFEFIKNNTQIARPSIRQSIINECIQKRLNDLKLRHSINKNDINIDLIIQNIVKYNRIFASKPVEWYKADKLFTNNKVITELIFEKAKKNNCFIGLVNIDSLIKKCIGAEYD